MRKRILIVDDEPKVLNALELRLSAEGFEVLKATNGKEALSQALRHSPDLIILDVLLPDLDGTQVVAFLSDNPATESIPIVFLTALQNKQEEREHGNYIGNNWIFAKPFDGKELAGNIREIISQRKT